MSNKILSALKKFVIFVLPIMFLMIAILIHFNSGKFFLSSVDPEYFHLFNGLNLSVFNLGVDYIAHPGTTIQVTYAISAHIVDLTQPGSDIISNAMNNPEQYIHGANILLNILTGITIFALGYYVYKYTGSIFLALLLQLMPFGNYHILLMSGRLIPEAVIIAPLLLLALLVVLFLYDQNRDENRNKYLIGFAIIGGLGVAGKVLFFPFLIIPLFLFQSSKDKLKYLLYTFISIMIFAFPMFVNFNKSWEWYSNMLLHSGKWGAGENSIVDLNTFPNNIIKIYSIDKTLFIISGVLMIELLIVTLISLIKKQPFNRLLYLITAGFLTAFFLSVIIVAKHFAYHYFFPTLILKIFFLFLIAELLLAQINAKRIKLFIHFVFFVIALIFSVGQVKVLKNAVNHKVKRAAIYQDQMDQLEEYPLDGSPIIITSHYRGSPFIQSAMGSGFLMSGSLKSTFTEILRKKYPNTYFYYGWTDKFYSWDKYKDAKSFVDPAKPVYIFIGKGNKDSLKLILSRIKTDFPEYEIKSTLLYKFIDLDEFFYKVNLFKREITNSNPNL